MEKKIIIRCMCLIYKNDNELNLKLKISLKEEMDILLH